MPLKGNAITIYIADTIFVTHVTEVLNACSICMLNLFYNLFRSDDDSWGDVSDNSDEEYYLNSDKKGADGFPLPPMSFALVPVQHPGFLSNKKSADKRTKKRENLKKPKDNHPVSAYNAFITTGVS